MELPQLKTLAQWDMVERILVEENVKEIANIFGVERVYLLSKQGNTIKDPRRGLVKKGGVRYGEHF